MSSSPPLMTSAHVSARSLERLRKANLDHAPEFLDFREKHWGRPGVATVPVPQELVELGIPNPLVFIPHTNEFDSNLKGSPILVRSEYRRLWRYIHGDFFNDAAEPEKRNCTATIVWGHPGIGKSLSLVYLMVAAAEMRLPFVFYRTGFSNAYVCLDAGDFSIPFELLYNLEHTARTLILFDSSVDLELREATYRRAKNTHAVLASSPSNQRHGPLAKVRQARYYTMDVVPLHEFRAMTYLRNSISADTPIDYISLSSTLGAEAVDLDVRNDDSYVETDYAAVGDDTDVDDVDDAPVPRVVGQKKFWNYMDLYRLLGPNARTAFADIVWRSGDPHQDLINLTTFSMHVKDSDYIEVLKVLADPGSGHVAGGSVRASGFHKLFFEISDPRSKLTDQPPNLHMVPTAFLRHVVLQLVDRLQQAEQLMFLDAVRGTGSIHGTILEGAILSYLPTAAVRAVLPDTTIIIAPQPSIPSFRVLKNQPALPPPVSGPPARHIWDPTTDDVPTQAGFYAFTKGFASGDALILADAGGRWPTRYEIIVQVTVAKKHDVKLSGIKKVTDALDRHQPERRTRLFLFVTRDDSRSKKLAAGTYKALKDWNVGHVTVTMEDLFRVLQPPS